MAFLSDASGNLRGRVRLGFDHFGILGAARRDLHTEKSKAENASSTKRAIAVKVRRTHQLITSHWRSAVTAPHEIRLQ